MYHFPCNVCDVRFESLILHNTYSLHICTTYVFTLLFTTFSVSHTTDDLVFIWDPQMPLDVDKGIELPQLELISTKNDDCTTEYSTGN